VKKNALYKYALEQQGSKTWRVCFAGWRLRLIRQIKNSRKRKGRQIMLTCLILSASYIVQ
jgi:hypothetical protein